MEMSNRNSIVFLSLSTNETVNLETTAKIQEILSADKAFDFTQNDANSTHENIIQFLRESTFDLYKKNSDAESLNKLHERYEKGDYFESNVIDAIYAGLLETIANFTKWLTHLTQKFPGFHKFDTEDLSVLVSSAALSLFGFHFRSFYRNEENHLILANNILYSRAKMNFLFDKVLIDLVFLYVNLLNSLNLTECEVALFYPLILLSCDG